MLSRSRSRGPRRGASLSGSHCEAAHDLRSGRVAYRRIFTWHARTSPAARICCRGAPIRPTRTKLRCWPAP